MSLKSKFQEQLRESLLSAKPVEIRTLRSIITAITNGEKEEGKELTEADINKILNKLVKERRNSIDAYEKAGEKGAVLKQKEMEELAFLEQYLPKAMSTEEVNSAVKEIITQGNYGKADMGKVMKEFNTKFTGQADGRVVSEIVKSLLA